MDNTKVQMSDSPGLYRRILILLRKSLLGTFSMPTQTKRGIPRRSRLFVRGRRPSALSVCHGYRTNIQDMCLGDTVAINLRINLYLPKVNTSPKVVRVACVTAMDVWGLQNPTYPGIPKASYQTYPTYSGVLPGYPRELYRGLQAAVLLRYV